jgi:branched-chain amino acid transport system substrate-binding protein
MQLQQQSSAQRNYVTRLVIVLTILTLVLTACSDNSAQTPVSSLTAAPSANEIKIGVIYATSGSYAVAGQEGLRGIELALAEVDGKIGNKKITLVKAGTNATSQVARDAARKLIEQDKVDLVVGPLSSDEGLAVRNYARTQPDIVFLSGTAGAQDMTLRDPAPNFYRFSTDGVQWMAGLGTYAYQDRNYKRIAVLANDYSFAYTQVGGFMTEFCRAGGHVSTKIWVPLGTSDYSTVMSSLPKDVQALFVVLGGSDALNFLKQYSQSGGKLPLLAGTTTVDQSAMVSKSALYDLLDGTLSSGPIADDNPDPAWQQFLQAYHAKYPDGLDSPSAFGYTYYLNTKAGLLALKQVDGDLSNGEARFKEALNKLQFDSPTGPVKIDKNRNAIANIYLREVDKKPDGTLYNKLIRTIPNVDQTRGLPEEEYLKLGIFGRDNPNCP